MHWAELALELILMPLVAFIIGLFMVLMMRKIAARLQRRVGVKRWHVGAMVLEMRLRPYEG